MSVWYNFRGEGKLTEMKLKNFLKDRLMAKMLAVT